MATTKKQDYLSAIYKMQQNGQPVRSSRLAGQLGITPAAVTDMMRRLIDEDYAFRDPDGAICLTAVGETTALSTVRKHRLVERFLTDTLGLSWDVAHAEAGNIEHVLSAEVEAGLAKFLGQPDTCPHGHPIPDRDGAVQPERERTTLDELNVGDTARILSILEESAEILKYLATLGMTPDTVIRVEELAPFGGPVLVTVRGAKYALGRQVAAKISVERLAGKAKSAKKDKSRR